MKNILPLALLCLIFTLTSCGDDEVVTGQLLVTNCDYFPYNSTSKASSKITTYNAFGDPSSTVKLDQLLFSGTKTMFDIDWLESVPQSPVNTQTGEVGMPITSLSTCEAGFVESYIPEFFHESVVNGISIMQESEPIRIKLMPVTDLTVGDTWIGGEANVSSTLEDSETKSVTESTNVYSFTLMGLDQEVTIEGDTYSDVAILESKINISSVNTITDNQGTDITTFESESSGKYYISKSFGTLRTDTYAVDFFNPTELTLSSRQDFFDIKI